MTGFKELIGKEVVLDTNTRFLYVGTLIKWNKESVILEKADVFDQEKSMKSRDLHLLEALKGGINYNRHCVRVMVSSIVSVSLLSEVREF
ncbi:MAG: hypothetical protein HQK84_07355 [Nitrospinae bacterium]|nr:hypothetical protein [Nitrospinota bacterium]